MTQLAKFSHMIFTLKAGKELAPNAKILMLQLFLDQHGLHRVGGRLNISNGEFAIQNSIILPRKERFTRLLIEKKHLRLLHAGPTLVAASPAQKVHITGSRRIIHTVTRGCVTCRYGRPTSPFAVGATSIPCHRLNPEMIFAG